jgi:hypothetical protein
VITTSVVAGVAGASVHSAFMYAKARFGILPSFQPYETLQALLNHLFAGDTHPALAWALSFLSGATLIGLLFGRAYRFLPSENWFGKGVVFGVLAWALLGLLFFPVIGLGLFATAPGLGFAPALLSLAMLLSYGVAMGAVYAALSTRPKI